MIRTQIIVIQARHRDWTLWRSDGKDWH